MNIKQQREMIQQPMDHSTLEIILEVVKYLGVLTTAFFAYLAIVRGKTIKEQKIINRNLQEIVYDVNSIKLKELFDIKRFSHLERYIKVIFEETKVNRFGIAFAMNGKTNFDFLTIIYDQKLGDTTLGGESLYQHFPIDKTYQDLIKKLEFEKKVWGDVDDKNLGSIGRFMRLEDIQAAGWFFIERIKIDRLNDVLLFCVFSTGEESGYVHLCKEKIELIANGKIVPKIKEIISTKLLEEDKL